MTILKSWDSFIWDLGAGQEHEVLSKGELTILKALYNLSNPEGVFVDVGAYIGYYSVRMIPHFKKVIAFEPNPYSYVKLIKNVQLNYGKDYTNFFTAYNFALGDKHEHKKFYIRQASSTFMPLDNHKYPILETIDVEVRRMDDVVDVADVVKIDTEAYELYVIKGMGRILEECKPSLVIEHHEWRGYKINQYQEIRRLLSKMGYICMNLRYGNEGAHKLYHHPDRGLEKVYDMVAWHWINYCLENISKGRPWYYGLPYTWWWGMSLIDFIFEIRNHVEDEPEWINLIKQEHP
uniref:FkbM family methyltransferase n=2 Tax=cellular organisms TaxID=131567 RepID=A0A7C4RYN6_FERPE